VAKDAAHTVDWFTKYIRDPKSKNPKARMKAFPSAEINDADLKQLAEFLATLK
jgi:hypothetical protein